MPIALDLQIKEQLFQIGRLSEEITQLSKTIQRVVAQSGMDFERFAPGIEVAVMVTAARESLKQARNVLHKEVVSTKAK